MSTQAPDSTPPYFRLSLFYVFYFAALGAFAPYWSVYLKHLSFTAIEIGQLMSLFMFTKLVAPFAWGWLTDHTGKRLKWIQVASFLTIPSLLLIFIDQSYFWISFATVLFGFFWNASLPQYEALTLNHLGKKSHEYSKVRLWGSVGFIVAVACLPMLFKYQSINVLPIVLLGLFSLTWFSTALITDRDHSDHSKNRKQSLIQILKAPKVVAFLLACVLQTLSHGAYYTFFSIYLEDHGYSTGMVGLMWALGVLAEVVLFIFIARVFNKFSAYQLFTVSLVLTAISWVLLGEYVDNLMVLLLVQCLHAASFGLFHVSAIHIIHDWFPGRLQGRGQAIYAGLSFGLGGALGSLLSGYLWEFSNTTTTFYIMAGIAFLGWLVSLVTTRRGHTNRKSQVHDQIT